MTVGYSGESCVHPTPTNVSNQLIKQWSLRVSSVWTWTNTEHMRTQGRGVDVVDRAGSIYSRDCMERTQPATISL